jgi:hypothetical protein
MTKRKSRPNGESTPLTEHPDLEVLSRIRTEGLSRSQVMELAWVITDRFGPRFANSPSYDAAAAWARDKFEEFGLVNASLEAWGEFGYAWENRYMSAHMVAPRYQPLIAYAVPGTRGTEGAVRGTPVLVQVDKIMKKADLEFYRGQLAGRLVLTHAPRELEPNYQPQAVRLSNDELEEMARPDVGDSGARDDGVASSKPSADEPLAWNEIEGFFENEGVSAVLSPGMSNVGPMDKGLVTVTGKGPFPLGSSPLLPRFVVAAEHYNRIARLLKNGDKPELLVESRNYLLDDDPLDYNILAEIPGGHLSDEVVMIGAHLDAQPSGTGATDNAAGSAVVMEAMRLLKAVEVQPRRTIRAALWGAEESGHLGSLGYVAKHFGKGDVDEKRAERVGFYVYFNVDWYGRFRGIYLQGNDEARPIFEAAMAPLRDLGMEWIVPGNTGGTDHMSFLKSGLPAFQFIQDDLEFFSVAFHTNMDVFDRLVEEDLQQAAIVLASFAYHAATRDGPFPYSDGLNNGRRWHK